MIMHCQSGKIRGALVIVIVLALILGVTIYLEKNSASKIENNKIRIVTSFYPLANFSQNIGKEYVQISNITPAGAEPHDYEPTPQDIANIYNSQLFIFNGNNLDSWADKIRTDLEKNNVKVIKISEHLDSIKTETGNDPHFWLDPVDTIKQVEIITNALIQIDPQHTNEYINNRNEYKLKLEELDGEYRNGLSNCEQREIITSHNAFNYLSSRYGFNTLYILGLNPDTEPSPKAIADLSRIAKGKNIQYIFFETLVSPNIAHTIADEIGGQTLVLNPIEGLTKEESLANKDYISIMKDNLINLKLAMKCK